MESYALISDCHSAALVQRTGSIDWWCVPRIDSASCFGRLLDWDRGGYCWIRPADKNSTSFRSYVEGTMVLSTVFSSSGGEARIFDCLVITDDDVDNPRCQLLRVIEGVRGRIDFKIDLCVRFDYGEVKPWLRYHGSRVYSAIGGSDGLMISSDVELERQGRHDLSGRFTVRAQERVRLSVEFMEPTQMSSAPPQPKELDERLEHTIRWWQGWSDQVTLDGMYRPGVTRSALVLKGLSQLRSGAITAAATTSLPESPGGRRNWDYRYSWIRDSSFSVRSLTDIGCFREADAFRRFIQRSAAGSAEDLQIMYGVEGERRLTEIELPLDGYRGARPVRIGNLASRQLQMDAYGELLELTWRWHLLGHSPDDDYWRFLYEVVELAVDRWAGPDRGLWEIRGEPQHFVHSKVMCWVALDRGLKLAEQSMRKVPERRWRKARAAIRAAVEAKGYDPKRGTFLQAFGSKNVDSSLLLLPTVGFVDFNDPRMVGTVAAIREDLMEDGLALRYRTGKTADGVGGREGSFVACTFWLSECLSRQGQLDDARVLFDRALATGNDLGLFAEEYDTRSKQMLGNFPQALTHLSHISAAVALTAQQIPSTESNIVDREAGSVVKNAA
ncbi:MAG TPA: glycoside hydrolase family 15 protein [Candidatus Dormibacteraeota bacterium]|nr:glycoside hydrolase family 15 protein [Candidatus Dormibacteraeota bacterium]